MTLKELEVAQHESAQKIADLTSDVAGIHTELTGIHSELSEIRSEMKEIRSEMKAEREENARIRSFFEKMEFRLLEKMEQFLSVAVNPDPPIPEIRSEMKAEREENAGTRLVEKNADGNSEIDGFTTPPVALPIVNNVCEEIVIGDYLPVISTTIDNPGVVTGKNDIEESFSFGAKRCLMDCCVCVDGFTWIPTIHQCLQDVCSDIGTIRFCLYIVMFIENKKEFIMCFDPGILYNTLRIERSLLCFSPNNAYSNSTSFFLHGSTIFVLWKEMVTYAETASREWSMVCIWFYDPGIGCSTKIVRLSYIVLYLLELQYYECYVLSRTLELATCYSDELLAVLPEISATIPSDKELKNGRILMDCHIVGLLEDSTARSICAEHFSFLWEPRQWECQWQIDNIWEHSSYVEIQMFDPLPSSSDLHQTYGNIKSMKQKQSLLFNALQQGACVTAFYSCVAYDEFVSVIELSTLFFVKKQLILLLQMICKLLGVYYLDTLIRHIKFVSWYPSNGLAELALYTPIIQQFQYARIVVVVSKGAKAFGNAAHGLVLYAQFSVPLMLGNPKSVHIEEGKHIGYKFLMDKKVNKKVMYESFSLLFKLETENEGGWDTDLYVLFLKQHQHEWSSTNREGLKVLAVSKVADIWVSEVIQMLRRNGHMIIYLKMCSQWIQLCLSHTLQAVDKGRLMLDEPTEMAIAWLCLVVEVYYCGVVRKGLSHASVAGSSCKFSEVYTAQLGWQNLLVGSQLRWSGIMLHFRDCILQWLAYYNTLHTLQCILSSDHTLTGSINSVTLSYCGALICVSMIMAVGVFSDSCNAVISHMNPLTFTKSTRRELRIFHAMDDIIFAAADIEYGFSPTHRKEATLVSLVQMAYKGVTPQLVVLGSSLDVLLKSYGADGVQSATPRQWGHSRAIAKLHTSGMKWGQGSSEWDVFPLRHVSLGLTVKCLFLIIVSG